MMEKAVKNLGMTICVLAIAGVAHAGLVAVEDVVEAPTGYFLPDGKNAYDSPWYRWFNEDWRWTHTNPTAPAGHIGIVSAVLLIDAYDVDEFAPNPGDIEAGEVDVISVDGTDVGYLDQGYNAAWHVTELDVLSLLAPTMLVAMDIDSTHDSRTYAVTLRSSTLRVTYEMPEPEPPIPAPGAVLLGSLGVGLVGWLRRRRTF